MSKLDFKRGRFNADSETDRIFSGLKGWRDVFGDWLNYYRLNVNASSMDDIYDEAYGSAAEDLEYPGGPPPPYHGGTWLVYDPPVRLPCLHVVHIRGENEYGDKGFYYNDDLSAIVAFDMFVKSGMTYADIETGNYMRDRVVYDRWVFRVTQIHIRGQIQQRDIIVGIEATQLKPDELTDSPIFAQWSI